MKFPLALLSSSLLASTTLAVDLSNFTPGEGVPSDLKNFLATYFPTSEDPAATSSWTDWWAADGSLTFRGQLYTGAEQRLGIKQAILPTSRVITWNHVVGQVVVQAESEQSVTYAESVVVEIGNTTSGECGGYKGTVVAEIKKNAAGEADLTYSSGNYLTYVLDLPSTANVECGSLP